MYAYTITYLTFSMFLNNVFFIFKAITVIKLHIGSL